MLNFMIISDEDYATVLRVSLKQIQRIYPEARIFLYDWGISGKTRTEFEEEFKNLIIIDWSKKVEEIRNRLSNSTMGILTSFLDRNIPAKLRYFVDRRRRLGRYVFERLLIQKLMCIKHCSNSVGNEEIFWFDADVLLMAPIDEITEAEHDFAFTLRRRNEIQFSYNSCQALNVGVVFLGNNHIKRNLFLNKWIERTQKSREYCREQTAVTRIFEEHGRDIFRDYASFNHCVDGTDISVKFYPCEVYNFNWIEEAIDDPSLLEEVKLLHFKGRRHEAEHFRNLTSQLGIR